MALPALHEAQPDFVLLARWLEPLAKLAGFHTIPFDRGAREFLPAVSALKIHNFDRGVLFTPSFSSALMLQLAGIPERHGTNTDKRWLLLTKRIDGRLLTLQHRASAYMVLATGSAPATPPTPQLTVPAHLRAQFRRRVGNNDRLIGLVPGSHAPSRTWPAERFAALARALSKQARVVVFGAPGEREITKQVVPDSGIDLGGKTDLPMLAAGLAECSVVISNDTGPLHLAAAVGTRTISLWGAGNPSHTGPPQGHKIIRHKELPCLECVKNRCPRSGKGYILPDAYNECLHLITVDEIIAQYSG